VLGLIAGGRGRRIAPTAPCRRCSYRMDAAFVLFGRLAMIMKLRTPAPNLVLV
jgi:hypothetical protein